VDLKDIKAIIDLMKKNSISEFELEKQEFKIKLKRGGIGVVGAEEAPSLLYASPAAVPFREPAPQLAAPAPSATAAHEIEIKSPMIGTFYRAPSPESAPYIDVGSEVGPETVVCIIEAMKVMNEIEAEFGGVVREILAQEGAAVEAEALLFLIDPA